MDATTSAKPEVTTATTAVLLTDNKKEANPNDKLQTDNKLLNTGAKPFGFNKLNQSQVASSSWSSLKNAASAGSSANLSSNASDVEVAKSGIKNVDAFQKFKMQMLEKVGYFYYFIFHKNIKF